MPVEVAGVDHIYITVRDLERSGTFYDRVMPTLGFRRSDGIVGADPHISYRSRQLAYSLRPAREGAANHDPYAPGLHHLCFRVVDETAVDRAASELSEAGVKITQPRYYPEYGEDY